MKKKAKPYLWLDRTVAKVGPFVTLVRTEADYWHAIEHCKVPYPDKWVHGEGYAATHFLEHDTEGPCCIVSIYVTDQEPIAIAALLVHEAVHVVQHYFEQMGEHKPATEQFAYAVQYMSQTLMEEYVRQIDQEFPE